MSGHLALQAWIETCLEGRGDDDDDQEPVVDKFHHDVLVIHSDPV